MMDRFRRIKTSQLPSALEPISDLEFGDMSAPRELSFLLLIDEPLPATTIFQFPSHCESEQYSAKSNYRQNNNGWTQEYEDVPPLEKDPPEQQNKIYAVCENRKDLISNKPSTHHSPPTGSQTYRLSSSSYHESPFLAAVSNDR